jgi:hypothetical protein
MSEPETKTYQTFEDFWPFYVREHANPTNRTLHFIGTSLAMASVAAGLLTGRRALLLAAPVLGYGFAWVGHFVVQGNRPATFKYPLWSLRGDFKMWSKIAAGTMDAEVEQALKSNGVTESHEEAPAATQAGAHTVN